MKGAPTRVVGGSRRLGLVFVTIVFMACASLGCDLILGLPEEATFGTTGGGGAGGGSTTHAGGGGNGGVDNTTNGGSGGGCVVTDCPATGTDCVVAVCESSRCEQQIGMEGTSCTDHDG